MEKIKNLLGNKKMPVFLMILGALGVLIIAVSEMVPASDSASKSVSQTVSEDDFETQTEQKIKTLVTEITGDENVNVAITLETGVEYVYATTKNKDTAQRSNKSASENYNSEISDKSEETYIIINNGSCEQPLLLSTNEPSVRGVAIVCESGNDEIMSEKITKAVCTLLDISSRNVDVCGRNHNK